MSYLLATLMLPASIMVQRPVPCVPVEQGLAVIAENYQETIHWYTTNKKNVTAALTINPKTGSWSFIEFDHEKMCLLSAGDLNDNKQRKTVDFTLPDH